jgi:hypothetical protein
LNMKQQIATSPEREASVAWSVEAPRNAGFIFFLVAIINSSYLLFTCLWQLLSFLEDYLPVNLFLQLLHVEILVMVL